jgi:hypothetical protein
MRFHIITILLALFLTSCANEGVIVRKDTGPLPFYESLGVDGSYAFLLRDSAGSVRRQLVTPDVFERYAVGQYFNDLQPVATQSSDFKEVRTASATSVQKSRSLATAPVTHTGRRMASARKATHSRHTAGKGHKSRKAVAKRTPAHNRKKAVRVAQSHSVKATPNRQTLLATVDRSR